MIYPLIILYMLPSIIAITKWKRRGFKRIDDLVVVNTLLGWTVLAWFFTLRVAIWEEK